MSKDRKQEIYRYNLYISGKGICLVKKDKKR